MISSPTHRQRLENCLSGQQVDRLPVALWRHFPVADQHPDLLAKMTLEFQAQYDFDLIKVSPSSSYCLVDYGSKDEWRGNPEGTRDYTHRVIQNPEGWEKLPIMDPRQGMCGMTLKALQQIVHGNSSQAPVIQTIFNPLAQAKNLAGQNRLLYHMRMFPDAVKVGLKTITANTLHYLDECKSLGIDGIFFAVQHAQYQLLNESEFDEFCMQYDLEVLHEIQSMWLKVVHLHGEHVMFDKVASYPIDVINWHDRESEVDLSDGLKRFPGAACGGISRLETMLLGGPEKVRAEIVDAATRTGGRRLIIGTGCVMMTTSPIVNIEAACQAAKDFKVE